MARIQPVNQADAQGNLLGIPVLEEFATVEFGEAVFTADAVAEGMRRTLETFFENDMRFLAQFDA